VSAPRARFSLARHRLLRSDFERIYKLGRRAQGTGMAVVVLENERGHARLGLSVAKRHHKSAVRRNRVRRVFREAFRLSLAELPGNLDVVMILTDSAPVALAAARAELLALVARALKKKPRTAPAEP
jgi:ribonuclease P protein component